MVELTIVSGQVKFYGAGTCIILDAALSLCALFVTQSLFQSSGIYIGMKKAGSYGKRMIEDSGYLIPELDPRFCQELKYGIRYSEYYWY